MKLPDADHPITITPASRRWRATYRGRIIADSGEALILQESTYPPVVYFPRQDVVMDTLSRTGHATHCPYKGDAGYYSVNADGHAADNAVWTYERPYPAVASIKERLAFYPHHVKVEEVR